MKKNIRNFVLNLPGLNSYCNCEFPCSPIEIEHALPKSLLKKQLNTKTFKIANTDAHNLFRCCSQLNREKSNNLLGENYFPDEYSGMLARACLHMTFTYNMKFDEKLIRRWKNYSIMYRPEQFEYERARIIYLETRKLNYFITRYHSE